MSYDIMPSCRDTSGFGNHWLGWNILRPGLHFLALSLRATAKSSNLIIGPLGGSIRRLGIDNPLHAMSD
ncbi:hypothetical protein CGRA01v4_12297 [Colletotrichum graminicola]|nr:hypothetical protein CGRA01v4_12297 [Colletotrichum graminicola]